MPRRRRPGRPPNDVPTVQVGIRLSAPVWKRVQAAAKQQGKKPGAFVQEILERAVPETEGGGDG